MKKYMILILLVLSSAQYSVAGGDSEAALVQFPPSADIMTNYRQLIKRVVQPLDKMIFDNDCTEQEAIDFVKRQRVQLPPLFIARAIPVALNSAGASDESPLICGTIVDALLVETKIMEKKQDVAKQQGDWKAAEGLIWEIARKKVLTHVFRKSGVQCILSKEDVEDLVDIL